MVTLRLLGGVSLLDDAEPVTGPAAQRHALAILALLATSPGNRMSREKMVGYLWPEAHERVARNRLNTHLHTVRRQLGPDRLLSVGTDLRLNRPAVACDVFRFEEALEAGEYEAAVDIYRGPFLDGFHLTGSAPFEKQVDRHRAQLSRDYCTALEALAERAEQSGSPEQAAEWLRRLLDEDPYNSRITCRLMETLARAGDLSSAIRTAEEHAQRLRNDLGVAPNEQVAGLARRLELGEEVSDVEGAAGSKGSPPADERGIAVLPFEDLGGGDQARVLASGLHSDLLTRLAGFSGLTVISRSSVLRFAKTQEPISEIGGQLGVGTVLEGEVQQAGDRLRLNVQLIDARSESHLWAQTFDRKITASDLFEIQSELSELIASSLSVTLSSEERLRARRKPTGSMEAYRLCLRGRVLLELRTGSQMWKAVEWFRRATVVDPGYAQAWTGLAQALLMLHEYAYTVPEQALAQARRAAERAVELDPKSPEVQAILGLLHGAAGEGGPAIQALRRAVQLSPSYAEAHSLLSWYSPLLGRVSEGWKHAARAVDLDPLSHEAWANVAYCHVSLNEAEEALAPARRSRQLQPDYPTAPFYEGLALYHLGELDSAAALLRTVTLDWAPPAPDAVVALAAVRAGEPEPARKLLRKMQASDGEGASFYEGLMLAALRRSNEALDVLERIEAWNASPLLHFGSRSLRYHFPEILGPLRSGSRFQFILNQIDRSWGVRRDDSPDHATLRPD